MSDEFNSKLDEKLTESIDMVDRIGAALKNIRIGVRTSGNSAALLRGKAGGLLKGVFSDMGALSANLEDIAELV